MSSWIVMASESTTFKSNVSLVQALIIFHLDDGDGALNSFLASFVPCPLSLSLLQIYDHYNVSKGCGDGNTNHSEEYQTGVS